MALKQVLACDHCGETIPEGSRQAVSIDVENGVVDGTFDFVNFQHLSEWSAQRWAKRPGRKPTGEQPKKRGRPKKEAV